MNVSRCYSCWCSLRSCVAIAIAVHLAFVQSKQSSHGIFGRLFAVWTSSVWAMWPIIIIAENDWTDHMGDPLWSWRWTRSKLMNGSSRLFIICTISRQVSSLVFFLFYFDFVFRPAFYANEQNLEINGAIKSIAATAASQHMITVSAGFGAAIVVVRISECKLWR